MTALEKITKSPKMTAIGKAMKAAEGRGVLDHFAKVKVRKTK